MKINIFVIIGVAGALLLFAISFANKKPDNTSVVEGERKEINDSKYKLSPLKIQGTEVIDSHRAVVKLVGVTTDEFRFHTHQTSIDQLKKNLLEVKSWGVNMVVLYLQIPYKVDQRIGEIVEFSNWASENGLYTLIFPVVHGDDFVSKEDIRRNSEEVTYTAMGKNTEDILDKLSKELKNNVGVIYGMGAEHHNIPHELLYTRQLELVDTVRKNSPDSLVVINGMEYGHYLEMYQAVKPKQPNILYDIYQYVAADEADIDYKKCKMPDQYVRKLPIILGEFGGAYKTGFGSYKDLECISSFIFSAQKLRVGFVVHTIDNMSRMGLFDWKNQVTSKGKILQRALGVSSK